MSDAKAKPAKKAAPKKPAEHPKYIEMIAASIAALKEREWFVQTSHRQIHQSQLQGW